MKKTSISKEILLLAIFTAITVFTWIGLDVYRAFSKRETPKVLESQLKPLNPNLDRQVIENLKKRKLFEWEEVKILTPTPTPTQTIAEEES